MKKDTVVIITDTLTVASGHRMLVTMIVSVVVRYKELGLVAEDAMEKKLVAVEVENKDYR